MKMKQIYSRLSSMKKNDIIAIILLGVLLLVIVIPTGKSAQKTNDNSFFEEDEQCGREDEVEQKLKNILEKIDGVGQVKVMITLDDDGEYFSSENKQKVEGVLVVTENGDDPVARDNISKAIQALFDVEVHKIRIAKMISEDK